MADPPRVIAGVGDGSAQGGQCDRREHDGAATAQQRAVRYAPDPGHGGCCRNSREAATSPCRRPRTAGRAASPAARGRCPSADTASYLTAGLRGVPALPGSQVAGSVFSCMPCGAILLPVMAGGAWRGISLSMLVYFAAAKRKVARCRVRFMAATASALACDPPTGSGHPGRQPSSSTWRIPRAADHAPWT